MLNKTVKIIISLFVIIAFLVVLAIAYKNSDKNAQKNDEARLFEELKNNHPEFSASQLEFFRETAKKDKAIIVPCVGRSDADDCIASVAFLKSESGICGEIRDPKIKTGCAKIILQRTASEKIDKCQLLEGEGLFSCLKSIFVIYDTGEECSSLKPEKIQTSCEDVFYYEAAVVQGDAGLCKKVTNEKLNLYCVKNIIATDKVLDSDNDGLTDYEEKSIYGTDPKKSDTDGDGYSDGNEVKNGHNPLGQ